MNDWNGRFELIDPRSVVIDHRYQRPAKEGLIASIAANPRWEAFGVPPVFERQGSKGIFYCADGQQRIAGVLRSEEPPKRIPAVVFTVAGVEDEAAIFVLINEYRLQLTPIEKHCSKVTAKETDALAIERAVATAGFVFGRSHSPLAIGAISAVYYTYNQLGEEGVVQVLVQARDAWPEDRRALGPRFIRTLTDVIAERISDGGYSRSVLTKSLVRTTPGALFRKAEEIHFEQGVSKRIALRKAFKALAKV